MATNNLWINGTSISNSEMPMEHGWVKYTRMDLEGNETVLYDGRPCVMDVFAQALLDKHELDDFDRMAAISAWCEGAWEEALEYLDSTVAKTLRTGSL